MKRATIKTNTSDGYILEAFDGDDLTEKLQRIGFYEANAMSAIRYLSQRLSFDVTVDVGANIGIHSLVLSEHSNKVIAFEPVSETYQLLKKNIKSNGRENIITAYEAALSNSHGIKEISINDKNMGNSSFFGIDANRRKQIVKTEEGDNFLKKTNVNHVDFIKIDVEGYEAEVVEGLKKIILSSRPVVLIEWKSSLTRDNFLHRNIFGIIFKDYITFAIGSNTSKKSIGTGFFKNLNRIKNKFTNPQWGLYKFIARKSYSNIILIPKDKEPIIKEKIHI